MYSTVPSTMPALVNNCVSSDFRAACLALGQPEIQNFDVAARREHQVGRFDVAMYDAFRVSVVQRVRHLNADLDESRHIFIGPSRMRSLSGSPSTYSMARNHRSPSWPISWM